MELDQAITKLLEAEDYVRTGKISNQPVQMSLAMVKMSSYAGAVETKLAEYEKDFEVTYAQNLSKYMLNQGMKVTQAERMVDIDMAIMKGQIKYLTRIVASAWRQIGVLQSRINHLTKEAGTQV